MRELRAFFYRLTSVFARGRRERDLAEEIESHLQLHIEENVRCGMSPAEARRAALITLGGVEATKERCRDRGGLPFLEPLAQDMRYGVRLLRRSPGFAVVVILSLALGIGANTAMFSILNSLVLRSLPVKAPQQLAVVMQGDGNDDAWTYPIWKQLRRRQHLFAGVIASSSARFNTARRGQAAYVDGLFASRGFFEVLGVPAILGRTFAETDDDPAAVISHGYWQRRFGGSADVIGQTISLDGVTFTVIGVTPPEFFGPRVGRTFDVAVPFDTEPLIRGHESLLDDRSGWWLNMMIRRKPDQSLIQATAALRAVQPQIRAATVPTDWHPENLRDYLRQPWRLQPAANGISDVRYRYQRPLTIIMVVAGLVLVIACANIANLQLARASARRHELRMRLALGASRLRIARQLLTESLLLAGCGALIGLLFGQWGSRLLVHKLSTRTSPIVLDLSTDWRVMTFTAVVAIATALLFGTAPVLRASRLEPRQALKGQGRGLVGEGRMSVSNLFVVLQVALSLTLVVAAGLFVRTFTRLTSQHLGFDRSGVLVATVGGREDAIAVEDRATVFAQLRDAVAAVPGVASATTSLVTPVSGSSAQVSIELPDAPSMPAGNNVAYANYIGRDFFKTYGTRLLAGREFTSRDDATAPPVAIVNETFPRTFMDGTNPVGRVVRQGWSAGHPGKAREVVGYVEDAVYRDVRQTVPPTIYVPIDQHPDLWSGVDITIRAASGSPVLLTRPVAAALTRVRPDLSVTFRPLTEQVDDSLIQERVVATLSGLFGVLALLLAAVGLYGVTSYAVGRRRTEIGIRIALGAAPAGIVRMVLRRVACHLLVGLVAGGAATLWASRFVETLLYGLEPNDSVTLLGAASLLAIIGAIAGWLPARRAARINPAKVLHEG